jgi:pilus assembly protein CpaF
MVFDLKKRLDEKANGVKDAYDVKDEIIDHHAEVEQLELEDALTPQERHWQKEIYDQLLKVMDLTLLGSIEQKEVRTQIQTICERLFTDASAPLSMPVRQRITKMIEDDVLGLGPLEPLLADQSVSDILVNGYDSVYVERKGKLYSTNVRFRDDAHVMKVIDRIVTSVGRRIDESTPLVDARLQDGSRVNAIIPPLALDGPSISIRRFAVSRPSMDDLLAYRSLTPVMAKLLAAIIKSRLNVVISGGTGSGKTTLLNILSGYIPEDERIVTMEDAAELQLQQPHVVRLETRPANVEGKGEVTQRDLVRNSLRMRPDRIVVGEVRGGEALDMLSAMNTGHDGSLTTVHANSPRDALSRIENMIAMAGMNLAQKAVREQISSAINVVIQVSRTQDGTRKIVSIQEINGMEGEIITMSELFKFVQHGVDENGKVVGEYKATGVVPGFHAQFAQRGIDLPVEIYNPEYISKWEE